MDSRKLVLVGPQTAPENVWHHFESGIVLYAAKAFWSAAATNSILFTFIFRCRMADYWQDLWILYMHLTQPTGSAVLFVEVNIWIWKHLWDWGLQSKLIIFHRSPNQFSPVGLGINVPCKKKPCPAAIKEVVLHDWHFFLLVCQMCILFTCLLFERRVISLKWCTSWQLAPHGNFWLSKHTSAQNRPQGYAEVKFNRIY